MSASPAFFLLGANHHTAPLEIREKIALTGGKLEALADDLRAIPGLREHALLDTCNRVEIYGVATEAGAPARLEAAFCARHGMSAPAFEKIRLQLRDRAAIQHLLEVAAGLDSQMIGETEILGQVKGAYAEARARGAIGPVLHRVFQKTFQAAKYARTHTAIGEGRVSAPAVAVDLAVKIFGDLKRCHVLMVGAGEMGEKTVKAFKSRGVGRLSIATRREERARELAAAFEARAVGFNFVPETLVECDVVVCCTSSPEAVVTGQMAASAIARRPVRPLFFIDLAVPRDVEPAAARLSNVFLYNLDDLAGIAGENRTLRQSEVERARAFLAGRADALWRQVQERLAAAPESTSRSVGSV